MEKELRIGNLIAIKSLFTGCTNFKAVDHMDFFNIIAQDEVGRFMGDYQPIPLTEEWLMKFGYFADNGNKEIGLMYSLDDDYSYGVFIEKRKYYFNFQTPDKQFIHKKIKYVHQLQNLYFALTNKELTAKELI